MDGIVCIRCGTRKPEERFHWQITTVEGRKIRSRDRTCKACRYEQKRVRDRSLPPLTADDVVSRFLRLPLPR